MKPSFLSILTAFTAVFSLIVAVNLVPFVWGAPPEVPESNVDSEPDCELVLDIPAKLTKQTSAKGMVAIKNNGPAEVTLVMPGDGSDCRWRTPVIGWSIVSAAEKQEHPQEAPQFRGARCGNINPLTAKEVFTLAPGKAKLLSEWAGPWFYNLEPGKYRAVFYYQNVPDLKWSGLPLGDHDAKAMRRIQASTPVKLVSNEVVFEVVE